LFFGQLYWHRREKVWPVRKSFLTAVCRCSAFAFKLHLGTEDPSGNLYQ
jgi:hypothetical protein